MNHFCSELDKQARHRGRHDIFGFWSTKTCQFPLIHFWMYLLNQLKINDNTDYSIFAYHLHRCITIASAASGFGHIVTLHSHLLGASAFDAGVNCNHACHLILWLASLLVIIQHACVSFCFPSPIIILIMRHTCIRIALILHLYLSCRPQHSSFDLFF